MTNQDKRPRRWPGMLGWPGKGWRRARFALYSGRIRLGNWLRRRRKLRLDYLVMPVSGTLPERSGPPRNFIQRRLPLPPEPLSLEELNRRLAAIADADNLRGVVFLFQGLRAGLATLQNFRTALTRLRSAGKEVVVYTPYLDLTHYWAASAADRIIVPPMTDFEFLGLRSQAIFLKDALTQAGIEAQVFQTSAYKNAYNLLNQSDISPEAKEQLDWILDSVFDGLIEGMAASRQMESAALRAVIDSGPYSAQYAQKLGLVDDVAYEDELAELLGAPETGAEMKGATTADAEPHLRPDASGKRAKPATLATWSLGKSKLMRKAHRRTKRCVGVISLEGRIVMGPSRSSPVDIPLPFVGGAVSGEATLAQLLRVAERDHRMAALILHVDSGGGSALASDLIWREVLKVSRKKPVLAYMGNVAASGGYYVSAPANKIVAQPMTLTGSIGVVMAHLVTSGLFEKLGVKRVELSRGLHAGLGSDLAPLSDEAQKILADQIETTYRRFKRIVADGRKLDYDGLDPLCEGRVWTGSQALDNGLVDAHGDFEEAIRQAAELAGLPLEDGQVVANVNLHRRFGGFLLSMPLESKEDPLSALLDTAKRLVGQPLAIMPFEITFR